MRKLLSANFHALARSLWFWLCGGAMLAYAVFQMSQTVRWASRNEYIGVDVTTYRVGDFSLPLLLLMAVLCPLFLGADYHEGTIRNKLTVGHTRVQIYLANYTAMLAAALFYGALFVAVTLGMSLAFLPSSQVNPWLIAEKLLCSLPFILFVTAIFTLMSTLITLRAVPVLAIALAVVLLWLPRQLYDRLGESSQRPTQGTTFYEERDENGEIYLVFEADGIRYENLEDLPTEPNPAYVAEPVRSLYIFLFDALPGGQAFLISDSLVPLSPPWVPALYGALLALLTTYAGLAAFQRKNVK